jgi:putative transposase
MDIAENVIGKVFHLPTASGKQYFRAVMQYQDEKLLFFFPLRISHAADGEVMLGRWTTASQPFCHPISWFEQFEDDAITPVDLSLPSCTNLLASSLRADQRSKYDGVIRRLQSAAQPEALMLSVLYRAYNERLERIAANENVSRQTLARELATYFQVGMDAHKAALLQIFGTRKEKASSDVPACKRGRQNKAVKARHIAADDPGAGINATESIVGQIEMFLRSQPGGLSKAELYRRYADAHIHRAVGTLEDGTPIRQREPSQNITYGQFAYYVDKIQHKLERDAARVGRTRFTNNLRALLGTARDAIQYPGQCYIIDATTADVYLVSAVDRKLLIGRPVIYVVIDAFSSMILAVHVTLETANGDQAKVALYRALTPKDKLLQTLGRPTLMHALPAGIVMDTIFADRGEVLSEAGRELARTLKCELQIAAPYMANWKSLVERYFKVINELVLHWLPGGVRQRMKERGQRDVRYDGVLTLQGLQRLMNSLAAEWNLTHDMTGHVSGLMLRREIQATPLGFWNYGLSELHGSPRYIGRSDAIRQFLPTVDATINRRGIHGLEDLRFTADWMEGDARLYELRNQAGAKLFLDPDSPFGGFFPDPGTGELREVQLVDVRNYRDYPVTIEDIRMVEAYAPLQQFDTAPARDSIAATERGYRSSVVRDELKATKEAKASDTRSKAAQVASITENRLADRTLGAPAAGAEPPTNPDSGFVDDAVGWGASLDEFFERS